MWWFCAIIGEPHLSEDSEVPRNWSRPNPSRSRNAGGIAVWGAEPRLTLARSVDDQSLEGMFWKLNVFAAVSHVVVKPAV
jgi:hypothetical protein